jgi:hypothetical protein
MPRRLAPRPRIRHRPDPATEDQQAAVTGRAEAQADRDALANEGLDTAEVDERIGELDEKITESGLRGTVLPTRPRRHLLEGDKRKAAESMSRALFGG